jgi:hypothetical protein
MSLVIDRMVQRAEMWKKHNDSFPNTPQRKSSRYENRYQTNGAIHKYPSKKAGRP